jgi:hypothetical protein
MEQPTTYFGKTADGYKIYDRLNSHIHKEGMQKQQLIAEAISKIYANGINFKKEIVFFDRNIGLKHCVPTSDEDEIIMVYRKGREGKTPIVLNKEPIPCKELTVIIKAMPDTPDSYILITAYVGGESTREPWDKGITSEEERLECEKFWSTHALIYNQDLIDWERMEQA